MPVSANVASLSRRALLCGAVGSAAAALLAACGGEAPPTTAPTPASAGTSADAASTFASTPPAPSVSPMLSSTPTAPSAPPVPAMPATATTGGRTIVPATGITGASASIGTAPPGSVASTLAASVQARTVGPAGAIVTLPAGFVGSTPAATLTGVTPPADLVGRLSVPRVVFALPPTGDAAATLLAFADLLAYMAKALGAEVVGVIGPSAADTVDAMRARTVDAAILSPFAYLLAKQQAFAVPLAQGEAGDGMPALSSTVLIGRRDGGPNTPMDLRGKTVAFVTADPTFGQVLPAYLLATNPRLVEDRDYTVLRVPTWADAYTAVTMGRADAAALTNAFFQRGLEARTIDNDRVKVLDKSSEIAGSLVAARGDLPMSDADILAALLLTLNEQPAMSRLVRSTIAPPPDGAGIFGETAVKLRKAADATYGGARAIVAGFGVDLRALAH